MDHYVQRKPFPQQFNNIYHFSLIRIVVSHQLSLLNIPWDTFIAHEIFNGPQVIQSVPQEEEGPSGQPVIHENKTTGVPMFVTYERGTRRLFVVSRRVLSPPEVEGVSFSSLDHKQMLSSPGVKGDLPYSPAIQVGQQSKSKDKGKQKMHEEVLPEGQDRIFILIEEYVIDLGSQSSRLKDMIIKEKEDEIQALSLDIERAKWIIKFLE